VSQIHDHTNTLKGGPSVRLAAARALGQAKVRIAIPGLIGALTNNKDEPEDVTSAQEAQIAAARALAEIGDVSAVDGLAAVFLGEIEWEWDNAVWHETRVALDCLDPAWPKSMPERLVAAVKAQNFSYRNFEPEMGLPALPLLLPLLDDASRSLRFRAGEEISHIAGRDAARYIHPLFSHPHYIVRLFAARILDRIGVEIPSEYRDRVDWLRPRAWPPACCHRCGGSLSVTGQRVVCDNCFWLSCQECHAAAEKSCPDCGHKTFVSGDLYPFSFTLV